MFNNNNNTGSYIYPGPTRWSPMICYLTMVLWYHFPYFVMEGTLHACVYNRKNLNWGGKGSSDRGREMGRPGPLLKLMEEAVWVKRKMNKSFTQQWLDKHVRSNINQQQQLDFNMKDKRVQSSSLYTTLIQEIKNYVGMFLCLIPQSIFSLLLVYLIIL